MSLYCIVEGDIKNLSALVCRLSNCVCVCICVCRCMCVFAYACVVVSFHVFTLQIWGVKYRLTHNRLHAFTHLDTLRRLCYIFNHFVEYLNMIYEYCVICIYLEYLLIPHELKVIFIFTSSIIVNNYIISM